MNPHDEKKHLAAAGSSAAAGVPFSCQGCEKFARITQGGALWDKALLVLLEREETLLGDIVEHCGALVQIAQDQALEMMEILNREG